MCGGKGTNNIQAVHPKVAESPSQGSLSPSVTSIQAAVCGGKGPDNIQSVHANVAEPAYDIHAGPLVCPQSFRIICGSPPKGS
ncbi:hypothetical protein BDN67DRAFT_1015780 [Paxillus ammoniavirescens]|nr:hypothetical protein BDN67DRAFT_1015780 [Paxillus ammoniavirescens]